MAYNLDGSPIKYGTPFKKGDYKYTKTWWSTTSISEKNTLGITEVDDIDERFYSTSGTPKPIDDLKSNWIQSQKNEANKLLTDTDWMITRYVETTTVIPTKIKDQRAAVRTVCGEREAQITACADTDALCKLITDKSLKAWPTE